MAMLEDEDEPASARHFAIGQINFPTLSRNSCGTSRMPSGSSKMQSRMRRRAANKLVGGSATGSFMMQSAKIRFSSVKASTRGGVSTTALEVEEEEEEEVEEAATALK